MIKDSERSVYIAAHVTPEIKDAVRHAAGPLGISAFVSRAVEHALRDHAQPVSDAWYLAGPMSGLPECNYAAFDTAARELRALDIIIVSPHETFPVKDDSRWLECLRHDVKTLLSCHGMILLPGWTKSRGARLEVSIALSLEMPICLWQGQQLVTLDQGLQT